MLVLCRLRVVLPFHRYARNGGGKAAVEAVLSHGFYSTVMLVVLFAIFIWLIYPLMEENGWW